MCSKMNNILRKFPDSVQTQIPISLHSKNESRIKYQVELARHIAAMTP